MGNAERQEIPAGADGGEVSSLPLTTSTPGNFSCSEAAVGSGGFVWPADAHFLSGRDFSFEHPGLDIVAGLGSPVYAADSGFVRTAGNDPSGYGNMLEIDHGNGYSTVYAHLNTIEVVICQSVNAGQRIGSAGDTGNADGVHLHFAVIQDGVYIDPWSVLPAP
jgi:murein DD-endopeptidase MepM/ murein hydrolase activator NlpD